MPAMNARPASTHGSLICGSPAQGQHQHGPGSEEGGEDLHRPSPFHGLNTIANATSGSHAAGTTVTVAAASTGHAH